MNWRKEIFYFYDALMGGYFRSQIAEIDRIIVDPDSIESQRVINDRIERICDFAINNVGYYSNLPKQATADLNLFPVINKNIIRENTSQFLANSVNEKNLKKVVTSGSTGTPFIVYHDKTKVKRNSCDTIYFGRLAGYEIGTRLNYLKIWTKVNRKSKFKAWLENVSAIDVTKLSDEKIFEFYISLQKNSSKKAFLGYSSALETICLALQRNELNYPIPGIVSVISMSEALNDSSKSLLRKYFGVFPVSRYSNVENGIIAQQLTDGSKNFIVNWASYYLEILDLNSDDIVPLGQPGRIVVTDLFNRAMPMIRYDTGDIGVLDWSESGNMKLLTHVEGRKMDVVFDTSGQMVSSFTITNNMWLYPEIKQYQFIQLGEKEYLFKLNVDDVFTKEHQLIDEFRKIFGLDATINVEFVVEIPLLNSGKRRKVVNLNKNRTEI